MIPKNYRQWVEETLPNGNKYIITSKDEPKTESVRATLYTAQTRARFYLYILNIEENGRA